MASACVKGTPAARARARRRTVKPNAPEKNSTKPRPKRKAGLRTGDSDRSAAERTANDAVIAIDSARSRGGEVTGMVLKWKFHIEAIPSDQVTHTIPVRRYFELAQAAGALAEATAARPPRIRAPVQQNPCRTWAKPLKVLRNPGLSGR